MYQLDTYFRFYRLFQFVKWYFAQSLDYDFVHYFVVLKLWIVFEKQVIQRQLTLPELPVSNSSRVRLVLQEQGHNNEDYLYLLSREGIVSSPCPPPRNAGNRRIITAFNFFKRNIEGVLVNSDNPLNELRSIINKVNSAIMILITVDTLADANILFESINNTGMVLSSLDLIKNTLFRTIGLDRANTDIYYGLWTQMLEDLGGESKVHERYFRHYYNAFRKEINHKYSKVAPNSEKMYPIGNHATKSNLLSLYQQIISSNPNAFMQEICEGAKIYSRIMGYDAEDKTWHKMSELQKELFNLKNIEGTPSYILLLYLLKKQEELELQQTDLLAIVRILIRFFVRRNLTELPPTRDMRPLFMSIIDKIEEAKCMGNQVTEKIHSELQAVSVSDEEFARKLNGSIYEDNSKATRFILCAIATSGMNKETYVDLWGKESKKGKTVYSWTIEHIFPEGENIPDSWVDMVADGDRELAEELQRSYVHKLGNLTLSAYNGNLSNKSFTEKKETCDRDGNIIGYANGLNLNDDVVDKTEWTIETIKARTQRLVEIAMELFAL